MALKVPEGPNPKTIKYSDLLGCDFSQDASLIDRRHSPNMLNMISDEGGSPVKRKGWEVLYDTSTIRRRFSGLWSFEMNQTEYVITELKEHNSQGDFVSQKYYSVQDGELHEIGGVNRPDDVNCAFYYKNATLEGLFLLFEVAGLKLITIENDALVLKDVPPYVPKIFLSKRPTTGGGTAYEDINLLAKRVTDSYLTKQEGSYDDSNATTYKLSLKIESDAKYEYLDANGNWVQGSINYVLAGQTVTVSPAAGEPRVAGQDNVRITYNYYAEDKPKPTSCTNYALYSQGSMEHIFLTGNYMDKHKVWWSAIGDPTYFPDKNYIYLGADGGECMGFLTVGSDLAVIKNEQHNSTSNIYLIYNKEISSTTVNTDNGTTTNQEYTYAVKKIASANGAVSHNGFAVLGDEPLFLSSQGVFGIIPTNTTEDRVIRNRSRFVDKKLLTEPLLENSQMIVRNDYLFVFINKHIYVFDGRHKTGDERNNTNYLYEAYYWEIGAMAGTFRGICKSEGQIYFITPSQLCRFKNTGRLDDYSDGSHWDSTEGKQVGGVPIHAIWSTRNDDDNAPQMFKTMMKKGTMCTLAPFYRSSVYVYVIADGQKRFEIGRYYADKMGLFEEVDFDRFTFNTSEGPRDYFFRKKRKKYVRLQIFFENNELDEGFGLYHVIKTYTEIRYAK